MESGEEREAAPRLSPPPTQFRLSDQGCQGGALTGRAGDAGGCLEIKDSDDWHLKYVTDFTPLQFHPSKVNIKKNSAKRLKKLCCTWQDCI